MKRMKNRRSALAVLLLACILALTAAAPSSVEAASRPKQVKNVKVTKTTEGSVKVKFGKVKGAEYYQVLIYQDDVPGMHFDGKVHYKYYNGEKYYLGTPLVYAPKTKKTTYTIKHLTGGTKYTVKVRAYKKGKYGKMSKGKKCRTKGYKNLQYVCNTCGARIPYYEGKDPGKDYRYYAMLHGRAVCEVHREAHYGATLW